MPLITVTAGTPIVPPGTYPATLIGVRPKSLVTKYSKNGEEQDFLEWTWLVDGPNDAVEITSLTSLSTGPKSTMFMILNALLGKDAVTIGAGFDEDDLVGKSVLVTTVVTEDGFSKIDQIVAAPKGKKIEMPGSTKAKAKKPEPEITIDGKDAEADDDEDDDDGDDDDLPF